MSKTIEVPTQTMTVSSTPLRGDASSTGRSSESFHVGYYQLHADAPDEFVRVVDKFLGPDRAATRRHSVLSPAHVRTTFSRPSGLRA